MHLISLLLAGLVCGLVSGFAITTLPAPTHWVPQRAFDAWASKPTEFLAGLYKDYELEAREVVTTTLNTCGYVNKNAYEPKICPTGLGCFWWRGDTPASRAVDCCPFDLAGEWNEADCLFPTTCLSYGQMNISAAVEWSETSSTTLLW